MKTLNKLKMVLSLLALLVTVFIAMTALKPSGIFTLNGNFMNTARGVLHLSYVDATGKRINDSAAMVDGKFSFRGTISEPTIAYLYTVQPNGVQLFLEQGLMTITAENGDLKTALVTGSNSQKEADELDNLIKPIRLEMEPLSTRYSEANMEYINARKTIKDEAILDSLKYRANAIHDEFDPYQQRIAKVQYQFFEKHPSSIVTAYNLRFYINSLPLDSIKLFFNRMSPIVRQMSYGKVIDEELKKVESGSPGSVAKNFASTNINGQTLTLNDFKGKYVLLDFWASWCVPCRKGNPHLKELYTKYKAKGFEVIGVSDDDRDLAAWKQAVAKDDLPWQHVLRGLKYDPAKGYDKTNDISELFGIHTLPTQILIDRTGKIIARYGGNGQPHEELDNTLAAVMK